MTEASLSVNIEHVLRVTEPAASTLSFELPECLPQFAWRSKFTTPLGVRARTWVRLKECCGGAPLQLDEVLAFFWRVCVPLCSNIVASFPATECSDQHTFLKSVGLEEMCPRGSWL